MTEVVLGIRFVIDGKEVAGEVRGQAAAFERMGQAARQGNDQGRVAAEQFTEKLKRQADTLGMTRLQTIAYEAGLQKLTAAENESVKQSVLAIEAYDRKQVMLGRVRTAAAGAGLAIAAMAATAIQLVRANAELQRYHEMTGKSVEQLSRLRYAADQTGVGFDTLVSAYQRLPKTIVEAFGPNSEAGRAFKALQLDPGQLRDNDQAMLLIADRLKGIQDPAVRAAAAQMIFKESGERLLPYLNQGSEGIKRLNQEGARWAEISGMDASAARDLEKKLVTLNYASIELGRGLASGLVPGLNTLIEKLLIASRATGSLQRGIGLMVSASSDYRSDLRAMPERIASLTEDQRRFMRHGSDTTSIGMALEAAYERLDYAKARQRQVALAGGGAESDVLTRRATTDYTALARQVTLADLAKPERETSAYDELLNRLRQKLVLEKESTEVQRLELELQEKKHASLTPQQQGELKGVAEQLDLKKQGQLLFETELALQREAQEKERGRVELGQRANRLRNEALDASRRGVQSGRDELAIAEKEQALMGAAEPVRIQQLALFRAEIEARQRIKELQEQQVPLTEADIDLIKRRAQEEATARGNAQVIRDRMQEAQALNQEIGRGLTDALMRGFESGKGFAENFRDSLENMFKTMVLRPVIQWVLSPVTNAIGGFMSSIPTLARAAGGAGGGGVNPQDGASAIGAAASATSALGPLWGGLAALALYSYRQESAYRIANWDKEKLGINEPSAALMRSIQSAGTAKFTGTDVSGVASETGASGLTFTAHSRDRYNEHIWGVPHYQPHTQGGFDEAIRGVYSEIRRVAEHTGMDSSRLAGSRVGFSFSTAAMENAYGPSAAQLVEAFKNNLGQVSDALALQLKPNLMSFAQAGETATQTLLRLVDVFDQLTAQEERISGSLRGMVRGLPGQLGITGLEQYRGALSVSEAVAPLDRVAAARSIYESTLGRALGGDLTAVQGFPQAAQQLLGIGRDVYASGSQYQELFKEVNRSLSDVLAHQGELQTEILADVPVAIQQASQDQVAELRKQTKEVVQALNGVREDLRRLREA